MFPSNQYSRQMNFAAICVRKPDDELVAAECVSLTGGEPEADGLAFCQTVEYIPQAAFLRTGLHILAHAPTLDDLLKAVAQTDFAADEFRIDFHSLSKEKGLRPQTSIVALANVIPFYPNLNHPKHRFVLLEREHGLWFGEIVSECQRTYQRHDAKPYRTSTSLDSQLSRALVNLVVPQARSLIDPCCGTGSILLESQFLGIQCYGADQNKRIVGMARQNLAHFGYQAIVENIEIQAYRRTADALVTDLPYGRLLDADERAIRAILEHGRNLAPVAVYVAGYDIADWLAAAGYRDIAVYPVTKHNRVVRFVHRAQASEQ